MADESKSQTPASPSGEGGARPKLAADEVERLDLEEWKLRAGSVLGVSPHAVHGALAADHSRKTWTEDQVRKALREFDAAVGDGE